MRGISEVQHHLMCDSKSPTTRFGRGSPAEGWLAPNSKEACKVAGK